MNFFPILTVRLLRPTCWWVLKQIIGVYSKSGIVMSRLCPRLSSNYIELCEGTLSKKYHALNWNSNISKKWCKWWGLWAQRNTLDPNVFYIAFEFTKFFFSFLIPPRWCFLFSSSLIFFVIYSITFVRFHSSRDYAVLSYSNPVSFQDNHFFSPFF